MDVLDNGLPGRLARGIGDGFMAREMTLYVRVGSDRGEFSSAGSSDLGRGGVMTTDPLHSSPGSPNSQA